VQALRQGVVLHGEPGDPPGGVPVRAAACEAAGERALRLTLTEGKYHQVKRMVAAAGNRVVALHRSAFGQLVLPPDLAPGQWRFLPQGMAAVTG
jgi:16S rRNA pseudouridine516 synthase